MSSAAAGDEQTQLIQYVRSKNKDKIETIVKALKKETSKKIREKIYDDVFNALNESDKQYLSNIILKVSEEDVSVDNLFLPEPIRGGRKSRKTKTNKKKRRITRRH